MKNQTVLVLSLWMFGFTVLALPASADETSALSDPTSATTISSNQNPNAFQQQNSVISNRNTVALLGTQGSGPVYLPDGSKLEFDWAGRLVKFTAPDGSQTLKFSYRDPADSSKITHIEEFYTKGTPAGQPRKSYFNLTTKKGTEEYPVSGNVVQQNLLYDIEVVAEGSVPSANYTVELASWMDADGKTVKIYGMMTRMRKDVRQLDGSITQHYFRADGSIYLVISAGEKLSWLTENGVTKIILTRPASTPSNVAVKTVFDLATGTATDTFADGTTATYTFVSSDVPASSSQQSYAEWEDWSGNKHYFLSPPIQSFYNEFSSVGGNLGAAKYTSTQVIFTNAWYQSAPWTSYSVAGASPNNLPLALTPEGWVASLLPGQMARSYLYTSNNSHYPAGSYVLMLSGTGKIVIRHGGVATTFTASGGIIDASVTANGFIFDVVQTDPNDPIKVTYFGLVEFATDHITNPFHPSYLDQLKGLDKLRFMDWSQTNNSPNKTWATRTTLASARQSTAKGVAYEYQIKLANMLGADMWINIPYNADANYITELATLLRDTLDSGRKVYVEFSNEVWNGLFSQADQNAQEALAAGITAPAYYAQKSIAVFKEFERVFGSKEQLNFVLATHTMNPWVTKQILATVVDGKSAAKWADTLAGTFYVGGKLGSAANAAATLAMTMSELFDAMHADINNSVNSYLRAQTYQLGLDAGLAVMVYEGGPHLVVANGVPAVTAQALTAKFAAANRDPLMYGLINAMLNAQKALGVTGFTFFNNQQGKYGSSGSWGLREFYDVFSYKFQAVMDWIEANPRWW